jgi:ribosomal protein L7Ae-like RNA K-turn-binding protein
MIGFAMRAGKVMIGTDLVCSSMSKSGTTRARLVLLTSTASEGTKKKIRCKCEFYGVDLRVIDMDGDQLGQLLGKTFSPAVIAISDDRFADEIRSAQDSIEDGEVK